MKKEWLIPIILVGLGVVAIGIGFLQHSRLLVAREPQNWVFRFPDGDCIAGEATVLRLGCNSCHQFARSGQLAHVEMGDIGPNLTVGYHHLSREYLAESVIKAHIAVADPTYEMKEDQAGMGKYNDYLTVKELTDMVAFLRQPPISMNDKD